MPSSGEPNENKAVAKDSDKATEASEVEQQQKKPAAHLEEDDEFEDFPVDGTSRPSQSFDSLAVIYKGLTSEIHGELDWTQEDTDPPRTNSNLWEESWDDDDVDEDFSAQLKYAWLNLFSRRIPGWTFASRQFALTVSTPTSAVDACACLATSFYSSLSLYISLSFHAFAPLIYAPRPVSIIRSSSQLYLLPLSQQSAPASLNSLTISSLSAPIIFFPSPKRSVSRRTPSPQRSSTKSPSM